MTGLELLEAQAREVGWWGWSNWRVQRGTPALSPGCRQWVYVGHGQRLAIWHPVTESEVELNFTHDGVPIATALLWLAFARDGATMERPCEACGGTRGTPGGENAHWGNPYGDPPEPCPDCCCTGREHVSIARLILDSMPRECEACLGVGELATGNEHAGMHEVHPCPECNGSGQVDPMSPDTRERLTIEADRRQVLGELRGEALSLWLAGELGWELFAGQGARATG